MTPKPSNWLLVPAGLSCLAMQFAFAYACAGPAPQVRVENPSELCAQALAMSSEVRTQAANVGLEPIELARKTCEAAVLAAKLAEANLVKTWGIAGATSSAVSPSMGLAGAAGSGG